MQHHPQHPQHRLQHHVNAPLPVRLAGPAGADHLVRGYLTLTAIRHRVGTLLLEEDHAHAATQLYALHAHGPQIADYTPTEVTNRLTFLASLDDLLDGRPSAADTAVVHRSGTALYGPVRGLRRLVGRRRTTRVGQ